MAFFKASKKEEDVQSSGGSSYINNSGMFPVNILAPIVSISKGGSTSIDMFVDYNGQEQIIYGNLRISNNDGSENAIGARVFNHLLVVTDTSSVADPEEMELPIGKAGATKTVAVLEDLADVDVIMRVQVEYRLWDGKVRENRNIRDFYRAEDKASAAEIVAGKGYGEAYENDLEYSKTISYSDGLTAEHIAQWVKDGREGNGGAGESPATTKAPSFSKKRFGK